VLKNVLPYSRTFWPLQTDKRTGRPKIWIYRDRDTGEPKGDATGTQHRCHFKEQSPALSRSGLL